MGRPNFPLYGDPDVGSAFEIIEKISVKIKNHNFTAKDIDEYTKANAVVIDYAKMLKSYDNKD